MDAVRSIITNMFIPSGKNILMYDIEGSHVTSYQAYFASHTRDRHVGFLFARDGIGKHNKMFRNFLVHTTTPNYN